MNTQESSLMWLAEMNVVVEDGDWVQRYSSRLFDPSTAGTAGRDAVLDGEVMFPAAIVEFFWRVKTIPRAAVAAALREVWLDAGLKTAPHDLSELFNDALTAREHLMSATELALLEALPFTITAYRGQLFSDGHLVPSGASWTLRREVADWYAAPVPLLGEPRGWVLQIDVPRTCVLALFTEREEDEVVLDLTAIDGAAQIVSARGTCDRFPQNLSLPRLSGAAL